MNLSRRKFLRLGLVAIAAPAIVRASSLMRVREVAAAELDAWVWVGSGKWQRITRYLGPAPLFVPEKTITGHYLGIRARIASGHSSGS